VSSQTPFRYVRLTADIRSTALLLHFKTDSLCWTRFWGNGGRGLCFAVLL